jgi:benzylsuccinate CoA-transferase BbsF subunit
MEAPSTGLLAGIRIIDNSWAAAGPYATELAALMGAEVIKVETSTHPDLFRRLADRPEAGLDDASRFNALNLRKRGLRLNLQKPMGVEVFRRLVAVSDAFVENYRPGVVERLGIAYDQLIEFRPNLVMVSISAAGRGGPHSGHPGYASIFNAMAGLGHLTGYREGPPTEVRDSVDLRVASVAGFALVAALLHRCRTGTGQWIDISAREAIASLVGDALVEHSLTAASPLRDGNHLGMNAPYEVFKCSGADAWAAIGVVTDDEWLRLCQAMGRPDLAEDARFADRLLRYEHADELEAVVTNWTSPRRRCWAGVNCWRIRTSSLEVSSRRWSTPSSASSAWCALPGCSPLPARAWSHRRCSGRTTTRSSLSCSATVRRRSRRCGPRMCSSSPGLRV